MANRNGITPNDVVPKSSVDQHQQSALTADLSQLRTYAHEANEASSLGICIMGETLNYLRALQHLASVAELPETELRERCYTIDGLAKMAVRFANEMEGLFEVIHEGHTKVLADIDAVRKAVSA